MDLNFTDSEDAFRRECRAWLEANVPREPLPSGDTKEGFALHLQWEHKLFDAGWAAVSWPKQYGGREATLFEWLIFEEEYYRVSAPSRVTQNGIFLLAPTLFEFGDRTITLQGQLPWLLMAPLFYGAVTTYLHRRSVEAEQSASRDA